MMMQLRQPKPFCIGCKRYGPCITLGALTKQTAATVVFRDYYGAISKRGGYRLKCGLIHIEPCRSCRDHPETQYPNGYEN